MKTSNFLKKIFLVVFTTLFILPIKAEEKKVIENNTEFNVFTGMFDFSDDGKRSNIIGIQHQNE